MQFLVPIADRAGRPYSRSLQRRIQAKLEARWGGWSLVGMVPLPGAWKNPLTGKIEKDRSWRYEVGIPESRLVELERDLSLLARELGQEAIWRVMVGEGKAILRAR